MHKPISIGVVLAGGASMRMRQDKSQLLLNGKTLLCRAQSTLASLVDKQLLDHWITSGSMQNAVPDLYSGKGPASGLLSIIVSQQLAVGDTLLAIPVDMPNLTESVLTDLRSFAENNRVSCCFASHWLPICIRITPTILKLANEFCCDGKHSERGMSLRRLFDVAQGIQLASPGATILKNVNTPNEWQALLSQSST